MKTHDAIRQTAIGAALLAAFGPATAAEGEDLFALTKPESAASVGLGFADSDGRRFGQYNGINESGAYGLLDLDLVKRDDETGTWLRFRGRDLGLDNRQLRFEHNRQGNWGYFIEASQIPRYEPYNVTTAVTGITTPDLTIPTAPTVGVPFDLKTRRDALGLGFDKFLSREWDVKVRFRNEEKEGARLWARGTTGGPGFGNFEFAPEPINSTTRQLEATLGYTGEKLQLSGGYYGTMYNNQYNGLNFTGGAAGLATFTPIALPPDNSSHQLYLAGGYGFTPTTRGTFKLAYAKAQQDDAFVTGVNVPLAPGISNNLQGRVDTTLAQAGVTSRPLPKLTLRADLRYEDRDDKTPVLRYNTLAGPTSTFNGDNEPRSIRSTTGKVEASYALPMAFRVTGGIEYEEKKRNISPVRIVSARETTDETSYRVELRRSMSETVTGALSYVHSERTGSPFLQTVVNNGTTGSNLIAPLHLADRTRDKVRLSANWTPADPLTIQFFVDEARDQYTGRDGLELGPRKGEAHNYSIDASYSFSDKWQATAWYSRNDTRAEQATCENASAVGVCPATAADPIWKANLRNVSDSLGLGLRGKPSGQLQIGVDVSYSDITDSYDQLALTPSTSTVPAPLPEVSTKLTRVNLFGRYALQKNSGVRLDYIYDRFNTNDWTWTTWTYLDGTVVSQSPVQEVHFIGVSYYYRWR
jgi:MtrB/PioB family decaheme-associated outer membrane protein